VDKQRRALLVVFGLSLCRRCLPLTFNVRPHMHRVEICGDRPDFRVVIDLLYGFGRNVDTDGDSVPVHSRVWQHLYIRDRESSDPSVEVAFDEEGPASLEVESKSTQLEELTALYLYLFCGRALYANGEKLTSEDIEALEKRYATQLHRAEVSIWHTSSNDNPYPNRVA